MRAVMEKAASGKAGGSTVPVKYTSRTSEIGEGALIRWSAEICAYLPAGALVNAASTRLRNCVGQSAPEASNNSSKVTGAGGEPPRLFVRSGQSPRGFNSAKACSGV